MKLELDDSSLNEMQVRSIRRLVERAKHAHHTDIRMRINGADEVIEADWLKHLRLPPGEGLDA
jgi:sugar phosphate isomerase/epimerase